MPDYQRSLAVPYLSNAANLPNDFQYSQLGRVYPDIALFGHGYGIVHQGALSLVDGTSASAPALAGLLGLFNEARLARGLPTLGFVNPLLYNLSQRVNNSFRDIAGGDNRCTMYGTCCDSGFSAAHGFDAVTG